MKGQTDDVNPHNELLCVIRTTPRTSTAERTILNFKCGECASSPARKRVGEAVSGIANVMSASCQYEHSTLVTVPNAAEPAPLTPTCLERITKDATKVNPESGKATMCTRIDTVRGMPCKQQLHADFARSSDTLTSAGTGNGAKSRAHFAEKRLGQGDGDVQ